MSFATIKTSTIVPKTVVFPTGCKNTVARSTPASKAVRCEAIKEDKVHVSRRGVVSLAAAAPAMQAAKALALIDYDEDDECVIFISALVPHA